MDRFSKVGGWVQAIVAALALLLNDHFQVLFNKDGTNAYYLTALILITVVAMKIADLGANFIIDNARWLRWILSGSDDIEGDWVNITLNVSAPSDIRFVEFCRIWYSKGVYVISGDSWTKDGAWVQEFCSISSSYYNRELTYTYRTGLNSVGGYGLLRFFPHDSRPSDFICSYQDDNSKTRHVTRGRLLRRSSPSLSLDERRDLALKFVSEFHDKKLLSVEEAMPQFR